MSGITRPALRWHGGKWRLAPWIIAQFPPHRVYVEPFGGGGSVLLRKERVPCEVYNDLDGEAVNMFRVLRSPDQAEMLTDLLRLTPYARAEFEQAYELIDDPVERARRLIVRSFMGHGSDGFNRANNTGFRPYSDARRSPPRDWAKYPDALSAIIERLAGVIIENRPAIEVMARHDAEHAVHYVDPPYLPETRSAKSRRGGRKYHAYVHELDEPDHAELLAFLPQLKGTVILSGYPSVMYDEALAGWRRIDRMTHADGARERCEVLWINRSSPAGALFERSA